MLELCSNDIENIAQRVVRAYCRLPSHQGTRIEHIDPEVLARELLGLSIEYHLLSVSGSVLGLTAQNKYMVTVYDNGSTGEDCVLRKKTIFVDRYLHETPEMAGRYHFTVGHECSHHILWMLFPAYSAQVAERRIHYCLANPNGSDEDERYMNPLASAILMPPQLLLVKMSEYGLGTHIKVLNRLTDSRGYKRFSDMAASLGVSKTALCIRMKKLGMLDREYLRDPYSPYDVRVDDADAAYFA